MAQNQEQGNKSETEAKIQMPAQVLQALANAAQSKFIKFADGQTMKLHFYPELTTSMKTTFNGKRDKPTARFKFMVTDRYKAGDIPLEHQNAKEWDTGSEVAKELREYFEKNQYDLQITRRGLDKSTKYRIDPM